MKKIFLIAAITLASASAGFAQTKSCEFEKWRGASKSAAQSWVGLGFGVKNSKSGELLSIKMDNGKNTDWFPAEAKVTKNFTTYTFRMTNSAAPGYIRNNRFSFRIYNSGKCKGRVDTEGFVPIDASGAWN